MKHAALVFLLFGPAAHAASPPETAALDLIARSIGFRTVAGPGNQTPAYAAFLKERLVAGGFDPGEVEVTPLGDTAYLVARWKGSDAAKKPLYISAHMDVVAADPKDWQRDPFTAVVEKGYVFGRGATDMKFDLSLVVQAVTDLRAAGYRPKRDVVLLFSGDEETTMKTTMAMAERFHDAEYLLNADAGGGDLDASDRPAFYRMSGGEKGYADYELTITDPGGHSSAPRPDNAIVELAGVLGRIGAYRFPPQINDLTRATMLAGAERADAKVAAALRGFVRDQGDAAALAVLRADPDWVGQVGTTCVPTMISGGHAPNALPQRASATINCRVFPGTPFEAVEATLRKVAAEPRLTLRRIENGELPGVASALRPDVMAAVTRVVQARYPGVTPVPGMEAGASDSMYFRARGVPSYGVSAIFIQPKDRFSHGLDERTPVANIAPGLRHWTGLIEALAK